MQDKDGNILDRREMLKVKVKSLAAEARIIRREEVRAKGGLRAQLHDHRVVVVRQEARIAQLAYGLIRGRTIDQMESTRREELARRTKARMAKVEKLCMRYGPLGFQLDLAA